MSITANGSISLVSLNNLKRLVYLSSVLVLYSPNCAFAADVKAASARAQKATTAQIVIPKRSTPSLQIIEETKNARTYTYPEFAEFTKSLKEYEQSNGLVREASATKSTAEAVSLLKKAIEIYPKNSYAYRTEAEIYEKKKQFKESLATLNKGIAAIPDDPTLYEKKVKILLALDDPTVALANATALVTFSPSSNYFILRADVYKSMHDKTAAANDLMRAITELEKGGDDAMDVVDQLEALTGSRVQRPNVDLNKSKIVLKNLITMFNSDKRFDPVFVGNLLGQRLYEIPIKGKPDTHTHEYSLSKTDNNFAELKMHALGADEGPYVALTVDTRNCFITEDEIQTAFGKPTITDDDPPGETIYKMPWGFLYFEFYRHGFKLLKTAGLSTVNHRYEYLQSRKHRN